MLSSKPKQKGRSATTPSTRHTSREAMSEISICINEQKSKFANFADDIKNSPCWTLATENGDPYNKYLRWPLKDGDKGDLHTYVNVLKLLEKHRSKKKANGDYLSHIVCLHDAVTTTDTQTPEPVVEPCADVESTKDAPSIIEVATDGHGQDETKADDVQDGHGQDTDSWKKEIDAQIEIDNAEAVIAPKVHQDNMFQHLRVNLAPSTQEEIEQATIQDEQKKEPRYKLLTCEDLQLFPPMEWKIHELMPKVGIGQIWGESAVGKTFLLIDMCYHVATGRKWFGYHVSQSPVVYIPLEGEHGFLKRIKAYEKYIGESLPYTFTYIIPSLTGKDVEDQTFAIDKKEDVREIAAIIPKGALIVIDTQNASSDADNNNTKDMKFLINGAKNLAKMTQGFVLLVAHSGKDPRKGVLGSGLQTPSMDCSIEVTRSSDVRTWKVRKSKDGEDGRSFAFKLEKIHLGIDDYSNEISSCVAVPTDKTTKQEKLTDAQQFALDNLKNCLAEEKSTSVEKETWRNSFLEAYKDKKPECKEDSARTAFNRAIEDLTKENILILQDDIILLVTDGHGQDTDKE